MSHSDNLVLQTAGVNDVWHYNEIHLDSQARDAGTNDEPVFNLPMPLHDVLGFKVLSARIPFSYYLIHDHNNIIRFFYYRDGYTGDATRTGVIIPVDLQLPIGNPTSPATLADTWQALINDALVDINPTAGYQYRVAFQPLVGSFEVYAVLKDTETRVTSLNNTSAVDFRGVSFQFPSNNGESCAAIFGFQPDALNGDIDNRGSAPVGGQPQPPSPGQKAAYAYYVNGNIVNLTGPNYLQLFSNLGNRLSNHLLLNGSTTSSPPVIAHIPVTEDPFDIIGYQDPNPAFMFDAGLSQIQSIQLSLRLGRDENHTLHLNDQPWKVVLMVLTQRETTVGRHVYPNDGGSNKRIRVR